jgi:hypothetical protein
MDLKVEARKKCKESIIFSAVYEGLGFIRKTRYATGRIYLL